MKTRVKVKGENQLTNLSSYLHVHCAVHTCAHNHRHVTMYKTLGPCIIFRVLIILSSALFSITDSVIMLFVCVCKELITFLKVFSETTAQEKVQGHFRSVLL